MSGSSLNIAAITPKETAKAHTKDVRILITIDAVIWRRVTDDDHCAPANNRLSQLINTELNQIEENWDEVIWIELVISILLIHVWDVESSVQVSEHGLQHYPGVKTHQTLISILAGSKSNSTSDDKLEEQWRGWTSISTCSSIQTVFLQLYTWVYVQTLSYWDQLSSIRIIIKGLATINA